MELSIKCRMCGHHTKVNVEREDYLKWVDGEHVQNAFPYLSPGVRELFISKTCETCFDKIFGKD